MIRRICCLCAAAMMLCTTAGAEQWASIRGIREDPRQEFKPWLNPDGTVADDGIDRRDGLP